MMNVQMRVHKLRPFITHSLVRIHQKQKIALQIAAKIGSVNGPLEMETVYPCSLVLNYH